MDLNSMSADMGSAFTKVAKCSIGCADAGKAAQLAANWNAAIDSGRSHVASLEISNTPTGRGGRS